MSIISSLFSGRRKILTSTPPKELEPIASKVEVQKINDLRALLTSNTVKDFNGAAMAMHFKDRLMELDLHNDYMTAFYACQVNPEAIVLFSEEIRQKFLSKTSIFSFLKTRSSSFDDASTLSAGSSRLTVAADDESTLSAGSSGRQSPTGSDDSFGSGISVYPLDRTAVTSRASLEQASHPKAHDSAQGASLVASIKPLSKTVAVTPDNGLSLALVPHVHKPSKAEVRSALQNAFMAHSLKVYLTSQKLIRTLNVSRTTTTQSASPLSAGVSVKIPQRSNVHPLILAAPKMTAATVARENPLSDLLKTAKFAQEFVLKLMVVESFPENIRPLARNILDNPDPALSLMILHVHKITPSQFRMWADTIVAHISSHGEILEAKAMTRMKKDFCQQISDDKAVQSSARIFIETPGALSVLKAIYQRRVSLKDGFTTLKDQFFSDIGTHRFISSFHPTHRRWAQEFLRSPSTSKLLAELKSRHCSAKQTLEALTFEFNAQKTLSTFINQYRGATKTEAIVLVESGLLEKMTKQAMSLGLSFSQTIQTLNIYFSFIATNGHYLEQFKEPALTKALEVLKEPATISKVITQVTLGLKDAAIKASVDAHIKARVKQKMTPSLAEIFPDIAPIFNTPAKPKSKLESTESLLKLLQGKIEEKHAKDVMEAACKALATNDESHLAMYTTQDLELLPKPLKELVLSKGFDITDWDEL